MRRAGFTMIELIFVIVVLGILASVALPKFIGVSEQAYEAKVKAFVGTMNRTVGPTLWSKSLSEGHDGSIKVFHGDGTDPDNPYDDFDLNSYIDLSEVGSLTKDNDDNVIAPDLSQCAAAGSTTGAKIFSLKVGEKEFEITCIDGSAAEAPKFNYTKN
ncbi:MAG: type II secretion system protein [Sulfurimonadaceae bacterium]|jgi:prepilin-type N-terminal cleavage/methylation domain-containing protein|nr:type II secretion system protein [Sulfurimonadaceae bacterium]